MSKVRFYLQAPKDFNEWKVFLNFSYNKKRLRYYTGMRIPPKYWNKETQRARESNKFRQFPEFNARLRKLADETLNIHRRFLNDGKVPSVAQIKSELDALTLRATTAGDTSLFGFVENFIEEREALPKYSTGVINIYKRTFKILKDFAQAKRKRLDFADIDLDFFADFQKFLYSPPRSYSQNTAQKIVKTLKTFLNEATEKGVNTKIDYKKKSFNIARVDVQSIYLTESELLKMYRLDLSDNPKLDRVRDLFLIGAYTGLRFSDFTTIKPGNIVMRDGVEQIQMTTKKTGSRVAIPIHPIVRAILAKREGQFPKSITNQKFNDYLKELAKEAGLTDAIMITKNKAGKRFDKRFEKWELVTTHTARRSFATNAFIAEMPVLSIMRITGHKTEKAFMKYIKFSNEENAIKMAKHAFFNTSVSPLKVAK